MTYITRHMAIDDFVIGRVNGVAHSNDEELTKVLRLIASDKTFEKRGNQKIVPGNQFVANIRNRLKFPFYLTTEAKNELEIYKDTVQGQS